MYKNEEKALDTAYDWQIAALFEDFLGHCRVYGALEADQRFRDGLSRLRGAYEACKAILDEPIDLRSACRRDKAEAMAAAIKRPED